MPAIDAIDEKKYGRLFAKYLPGVIRSDEEHNRLTGLLMKLTLSEGRTAEERLIELFERLAHDYGDRRMKGRLEGLGPLALLEHLMEERKLRQVGSCGLFRRAIGWVRGDGGQAQDQQRACTASCTRSRTGEGRPTKRWVWDYVDVYLHRQRGRQRGRRQAWKPRARQSACRAVFKG